MLIPNLIKRLQADQPLNDFFTAQYGKTLKHLWGYKDSPTLNELPLLCYLSVKSDIKNKKESLRTISIVIIVDDARILDIDNNVLTPDEQLTTDVQLFSGAVQSETAEFHIIKALTGFAIGDGSVISPNFTITNDFTFGYPFFNTEITFEVKNSTNIHNQ
jgi:hypothetical protein